MRLRINVEKGSNYIFLSAGFPLLRSTIPDFLLRAISEINDY